MDAPEKLRFGVEPHEVRPKDPQGAARELMREWCASIFAVVPNR